MIINTFSDYYYDNKLNITIKIKINNKILNKNKLGHLGVYKKILEDDNIIILKEACSICCEKYKTNQFKRILSDCKHIFHKKCIDAWFIKNNEMSCPTCRKNYDNIII
jgi:hypothetical protein